MSGIAVIPARGGSKGIARKNLQKVAGLPLVAHTILAARAARSIVHVVVTTDDPEIESVARSFGADVVRRPAALAGDHASSESALLHALDDLEARGVVLPELLVFLQCTSPMTTAAHIDGTVDTLLQRRADSAFTAAPFHGFLWDEGEDGEARALLHDKTHRPRRQDRVLPFVETGAVYVMRIAGFRAARHRFFGRTVFCPVPPEVAIEIDDPADLSIVRARMQSQAKDPGALPPRIRALVMDFDGVLTDNRVWTASDGTESVACSRGDGMGVSRLRELGLALLVLSKERNPVVAARCKKLGVPVIDSTDDKPTVLRAWLGERGIALEDTIYVGNDVNDLGCMRIVGCGVAVADAHASVLAEARMVLPLPGGHGAIRVLAEWIEAARSGEAAS